MRVALPEFSKANVLVVGDVMLDRYYHGATDRISPEAPVPVVRVQNSEERPGGAANVALNSVALGGKATILGMIGQDEAGAMLSESLNVAGVCCDFSSFADYPTITKLRVLSRHQQLIRLDFEENFSGVDNSDLQRRFELQLSKHSVVVVSDYNKGALSQVEKLIAMARNQNKPVLVDPKGSSFEKYRGATLLTPNFSEFEAVVGQCETEAQIVTKGQALIQSLELEALLVTRSEHGMTLLQKGKPALHLPAQAQEVFDVTGAGDTVISTLASALASGAQMDQACALANAAASVVVGKIGTSTVSLAELANALYVGQEGGFGVLDEQQLKFAVEAAHRRGEKVVMTNGCFDILHAGHVSYLKHAADLGDRLIVAVNSDDSVKMLKGPSRPINPLDRRMTVLAALGAVDWVVDFAEETPQRLIASILPDLLVKGGDYQPDEIAGGEEVIANGGEVRVLNFEDGISTSDMIRVIKTQDN
ncbi:bifunctional D-glycero-beta-D-manno-heptose-7-phosphate kinase/D-glycero-beta-D-manno-heptose 1-phosphate adenylyltransferase HldE [Alginatibacterium sediminis]|uniref:Bifunctional protein HldE n=1 Tax=Alginatibacterium sediminis TaxID=2164068 RepID=A0A420EDY6_9ALTE|nr:bifunctional D-glycero-beta-D-manno-heptose-7-phosphate kinase/D-glycero-beta-D-manno-heptose 1-phosphate adenylyltransferase HldE [Alginatibacterium sediminis]RKF18880.1 bifunctional D-glycero-beta-D-manno-heptose-7-phosphate kinase/D-glycero-beta-D-manno-heptose 1-phosphate adenylyltransferase HldE [Alginatibacterium sediminis]